MRRESTVKVESRQDSLDGVVGEPKHQYQGHINGVGLGLVDRYINGELYILIVFRVARESRDFAAFLKRSQCKSDLIRQVAPSSKYRSLDTERDEAAMLVDVIQLVQSPEAVLSSSVQIHPFEEILSFLPHSTHLSLISGYLVVGGWDVFGDREGGLCSGSASSGNDQFRRKVVERTVEVLDNIPSDQRDAVWKQGRRTDEDDVLSRCRITLAIDSVRVSFLEGVDHVPQFVDVLIGPLDF